ncbi:MAG: ABC transporter permease subunit [Rhodobacteraceae bacterium]|nr:ABC transporter permease subunit [Paracoccaceae bacterium]
MSAGLATAFRRMPSLRRTLETLFVAGIGLVALAPIIAIGVMSFDTSTLSEPFRAGTAAWSALFADTANLRALGYTVVLAIRVPIGLFMALIAVWIIVRLDAPGARLFEYLFWFAYFLPGLPVLTGWILLLDPDYGLLNRLALATGLFSGAPFNIYSAGGIVWTHLAGQTVPVMVILLAPAMRMIDRAMDEAAVLAGAGAWHILRRVIVPLMVPALAVAGIAAGVKSFESFETEQILGAPADIFVYSNRIYYLLNQITPRLPEAMAMSTVLVLFLLAASLGYQRYARRRAVPPSLGDGPRSGGRPVYRAGVRWAGTAALAVYALVAIVLPFAMLIAGSFMRLYGFFDLPAPWTAAHWHKALFSVDFRTAATSTLLLALLCALPGTLIFAGIAWVLAGLRGWRQSLAETLVWLPWALPGIILGAGLVEIMLSVPVFGPLHGTFYPLIYALLLREMPLGVSMLRASFAQTGREMVDAARLTGAGSLRILARIVLPLNMPALMVVFLLIFTLVLRDISTIVLIAPPGVQTLSLLAFKHSLNGDFEAASVIGTVVALASLAVSALAFQMARRVGGWR